MAQKSSAPYPFGDLLALARASWIREMAARLQDRGYDDYRRSDAAVMRLLRHRPIAIGRLGLVLGVTRQAARKVVSGLEQRDLAAVERDLHDSRQLNVVLTHEGFVYANAVVETIDTLNRELQERVDPTALAAAINVLQAAIFDEAARQRAAHLVTPSV